MAPQKITTLSDICKYLEKLDITIINMKPNLVAISYRVVDKRTGDVETEYRSFEADTIEKLFKKIHKWVWSKSLWVKQGRLLSINDPSDPYDFDLEYELLTSGFKLAEVEFEYTNFVEAWVTYCYIDENGKFRYDGSFIIDNIGDKQKTLDYLKLWIRKNPQFVPCKNKL